MVKNDEAVKPCNEFPQNGIAIPVADKLSCKALNVNIAMITPDIWKNYRRDASPWYESSQMAKKYCIALKDTLTEKYKHFLECVICENNFNRFIPVTLWKSLSKIL